MECNKDEATRAMSIADSKLKQKDFHGAKKFVLKAQNLYPGLHGIPQILTTLDVHLAAENKIRGEVDWYGVLDTNPSADYDTIKKQYRKLALMLHPDKNKSAGAESAFKLIAEAWRLLSDEEKRAAYNQRRGPRNTGATSAPCKPQQQKVPSASRKKKAPSAPSGKAPVPPRTSQKMENQFFNFASKANSTPRTQNGSAKKARAENAAPPQRRSDTFWTVCHGCTAHFEYYNVYRNHTLLCPRCGKTFLALEIAPPPKCVPWVRVEGSFKKIPGQNVYDPKGSFAAAQNPGADQTSPSPFKYTIYQQVPPSEAANADSTYTCTAEKLGNFQQASDNLKRSHVESHAFADDVGFFKKGKPDDDNNRYGTNYFMAQGNSGFGGFGSASAFGMGSYGFSGFCTQPSSTRELTPPETRSLLVHKAQEEIQTKLSDYRL